VWLANVRGADPHELPVDFVKAPAPAESDFVPHCSSETPHGTTSFEVRQALDRPVLWVDLSQPNFEVSAVGSRHRAELLPDAKVMEPLQEVLSHHPDGALLPSSSQCPLEPTGPVGPAEPVAPVAPVEPVAPGPHPTPS
jgi:hypothetical protein